MKRKAKPLEDSDLPSAGDNDEAPQRRGRPVGDREAKRIELLTAAISLMADEGYAGTSLRKVAARAGYTTGAVTYYFENKEALFGAVAEHLFDRFDTMLEIKDVKTSFSQWLDWTNTDTDLWLAQFQLLALARHEPAFATVFQRRYEHYREIFAFTLAEGQRGGTIRDDIPADLLADQLSAMADGWMLLRPIEPERFESVRVQRLLDAVVTLIAPLDTTERKKHAKRR